MAAAPTISSPNFNYVRPPMYEKQRLAMFEPRRWSLIEASTKAGKTVGCIVWLSEMAMAGSSGRNYWWVAPVYGTAKIAFNRMRRRFPKQMITANMSEMSIHILPTDTYIVFKSAEKPDSLYGEDVYAVVIDEASRVREEAWYAIRSTLTATRGPARIIGNVKGRKNWFFKMARRAEKDEDPNGAFHKITAWDAVEGGVLDRQEIEDARRELPEAVFKELYEAEAADDEGNPFGIAAIQACAWDGSDLSSEPVACWGVDLARKHDWTVGVGLDRWGRLAGWFRFQKPWPEQISTIREICGSVPTYVDATGVGDVVVGLLQAPVQQVRVYGENGKSIRVDADVLAGGNDDDDEIPGTELPPEITELERAFADTYIEGYLFNQKSKQSLMEGLAVSIQSNTISFPAQEPNGKEHPLKIELESYEYVYTRTGVRYSAPEGEYDDSVCACALAAKCMADKVVFGSADIAMGDLVNAFSQTSTWDFGVNRAAKQLEQAAVHADGRLEMDVEPEGDWDFGV